MIYFLARASKSFSHFQMTYGKETKEGIRKEFFQCDREKCCSNVIKTRSGKFETVNDEETLSKRKDISAIWKKMNRVEEIEGRMLCSFY